MRLSMFVAAAALCVLAACETGSGPDMQALTPTIASLTVTTPSPSVPLGLQGTVGLTVTRGGGYNGPITFAALGLPTGVIATFTPATLGNVETSTVLTLSVFPNVVPGTTSFTVRASGNGVADQTVSIPLTITVPDFALALGASTATAGIERPVTVPITITRTGGYPGFVDLSASGVPTAVTATFTPARLLAGVTTSTLTLTPRFGATVGTTSTITVNATGDGPPAKSGTVQLSVTEAPAPTFGLRALFNGPQPMLAGTSATATISALRAGGFTAPIALSVSGVPSGITTSLSAASIGAGASSTLTITAAANALIGNDIFTLRGSSPGLPDSTIAIGYRVSPPTGGADISIIAPGPVTIARGATGSIPVQLVRRFGATADVTFSIQGLPAGVTAALPAPAGGANGTITVPIPVTVAASAVPGSYPIAIRFTAPGFVGYAPATLVID